MVLTCGSCGTSYVVADRLVPGSGIPVKCTACGAIFQARAATHAPHRPSGRTLEELVAALLTDLRGLRRDALELRQRVRGQESETTDEHAVPTPPEGTPLPPRDPSWLTELHHVRQVPGESPRRWFASDDLDLIVWLDDAGAPSGFQLCYDKRSRHERAVTWRPGLGFAHAAVDEGDEARGVHYKASPLLLGDGAFDARYVRTQFERAASALPRDIAHFVSERLRGHGQP